VKVSLSDDGKSLIVELPLYNEPKMSSSGKTKIVASSRGNRSTKVLIDGKPVVVGANAYIKYDGGAESD